MENKLIFEDKELKKWTSLALGISGENEQETLVFEMSEGFIDGSCVLEIEFPDGTTNFIETDKNENNYSLIVKNSLLSQAGILKMQLKIIQNDVQVWKSKIFEMKVLNAINATETIEEDYPDFVTTTTVKLKELEEKINEIEIPSTGEGSEEIIISEEEPTTEEWKIWIDEDEDVPQYITNEVDDLKNYYSKTDIDKKITAIEVPEEVLIGTEEPTTEDWKLFVDESEEDEEYVLKTEIETELLENSTNPVSGGAVKTYVDENIRNIEMPSVEGFATEEYVQEEIAKVEVPSEIIISTEEPTEEWKVWIDEDEDVEFSSEISIGTKQPTDPNVKLFIDLNEQEIQYVTNDYVDAKLGEIETLLAEV